MAAIIHLRCRFCGEPLSDREREYCPPCNLYLAYRAMPIILGMLLLGPSAANWPRPQPVAVPTGGDEPRSYDNEADLIWE